MPSDLKIIAAYAGGTSIAWARLNAPSLYRVSLPYIRPVSASTVANPNGPQPPNNPNLFVSTDGPIGLKASEPLIIEATSAAAGNDTTAALVWLADKLDPVPDGDAFWLKYSQTTTATSTALQWTVVNYSWDQTPAPGTYAVVGLEHWCKTAIAARLNFPGQIFRPGVLALNNGAGAAAFPGANRTHSFFYEGKLGLWGTFQTFAPPILEVLTSDGATSTHEGYMRCIRIGEIGAMAATHTA